MTLMLLKDPADSYEELRQAIANGWTVEMCSINQHRDAFDWHPMSAIDKNFAPGRYRIWRPLPDSGVVPSDWKLLAR